MDVPALRNVQKLEAWPRVFTPRPDNTQLRAGSKSLI